MEYIIVISIMGGVIIGQMVERFFYAREVHKQLRAAQAALFSRNINDYLAATQDERRFDDSPSEPEEVELGDLSDDEWDQHIKSIN